VQRSTATPRAEISRSSPLARLLFFAYALLVVYASLYPLSGWRDPGVSVFAFLTDAWPRYVTPFDVAANLLGYLPLGFLCVLALHPRVSAPVAVLVALVAGTGLSTALEAAQSLLPARIPSKLDVLSNAAGALAGAMLALPLARWLLERGPLLALRTAWFTPGPRTDFGLVMLALWLLTQLDATTLLFGAGDLRESFTARAAGVHAPELFVTIEALVAFGQLVAVAALASALVSAAASALAVVAILLLAALAVKTAAFVIVFQAQNVFSWLTPGAMKGLMLGAPAALLVVALPRTLRLAVAASLLIGSTALVNFAPINPYLAAILKLWQQGHFLNMNGLTRLVSALWPFAALIYVFVLIAARFGRSA
jgi:VanZ family protein